MLPYSMIPFYILSYTTNPAALRRLYAANLYASSVHSTETGSCDQYVYETQLLEIRSLLLDCQEYGHVLFFIC
jgi:hypothetical protein